MQNLSGPALRAMAISRVLSSRFEVTLVSTSKCELHNELFELKYCDEKSLKSQVKCSDAVVFQGFTLSEFPWIAYSDAILISDLYAPFQIEHLEDLSQHDSTNNSRDSLQTIAAVNSQLRKADFFICASETQRMFWLGHLIAVGRISPALYKQDPTLRTLIDVVPFGIDQEFQKVTLGKVRNDSTGIKHDDFVLFWGGGIYNWFDPATLIKAVANLSPKFPQLKLFFLAGSHPDKTIPKSSREFEARQIATALGVNNSSVIFYKEWVPFEERAQYLSEIDMGVVTHFDSLETALSFRTRLLDCIWSSTPMLSSSGDAISRIIKKNSLGLVVEPLDQGAIEDAITSVLLDRNLLRKFSMNISEIRPSFYWETVAQPLLSYLSQTKFLRAKSYRLGNFPISYKKRNFISSKINGIRIRFHDGGITEVISRIVEKTKAWNKE